MTAQVLNAALSYAERGWRVHPLVSAGKTPMVRAWQHAATTDAGQIRAWWSLWPDSNIGIATGPESGLFVLDLDTLEAAKELPGALPDTPAVTTARGRHVYMAYPDITGPTTRAHLWPKVDSRGRGGFIVAPPSVHPSGHRYVWARLPTIPLAPAPAWLLRRLLPPPPKPRPPFRASSSYGLSQYAIAALRKSAERVAQAPAGERNNSLNGAAYSLGRLAGAGHIQPDIIAEELARAALAAGLTMPEIQRTITSGLAAGMANPRQIEDRSHECR